MPWEERMRPLPQESSSPNSGTRIRVRPIRLQTPKQCVQQPVTSPVSDPNPGPSLSCQNLSPGLLSFLSRLYIAPSPKPWATEVIVPSKEKEEVPVFHIRGGVERLAELKSACHVLHVLSDQAYPIINLLCHDV